MRRLYDNQDMKCFWIREVEGDTFGVAIVVVVAMVVVAVAGLEIASYCLIENRVIHRDFKIPMV